MGVFSNLFKKRKNAKDSKLLADKLGQTPKKENSTTQSYSFADKTIIEHTDEVLDTNSPENIAKFKHNLKVLIDQAKNKGKVDNFYIIREDDFFPKNWEWTVLSEQTNLEQITTALSYEVRKAYALEQAGIQPYKDVMGIPVPNVTSKQEQEVLSKIDKTLGTVLMPSHFRSTKHFTVNTPLGYTGDYNSVKSNRKFIVFDKIDNFLNSGYGYSVAGHDAYLDVTHESLKISDQGFVLIDDEKYDEIMKEPEVQEELLKRKIVRFKGDACTAINMMLASNGALPTQVGYNYVIYDDELRNIYENSFKNLAKENGLMYDKSHGGKLSPEGGGHFSNYYDEKNTDHHTSMKEFYEFLKQSFPGNEELFLKSFVFNSNNVQVIVQKLGAKNILDAINKYNDKVKSEMSKKHENYRVDKSSITSDEHNRFVNTVRAIDQFYKTPESSGRSDVEETIQLFFQGKSKEEQLEASTKILTWFGIIPTAIKNVNRRGVKRGECS